MFRFLIFVFSQWRNYVFIIICCRGSERRWSSFHRLWKLISVANNWLDFVDFATSGIYFVISLVFPSVYMFRFDMNFVKFRVTFFFCFNAENILFNIRVTHRNRTIISIKWQRPSFIKRYRNTEEQAWCTSPWTRPQLFGEKLRLPYKDVKLPMLKGILDCPTHSLPLVDRSLWCFGVIEVKILNACFRGLCFLRALNIYGWLSSISMQR